MSEALWVPSDEVAAAANLTAAIRECGRASYSDFYDWSAVARSEFWGYTIDRLGIVMTRPPRSILEGTPQRPAWLAGARLNIAESCFTADPDSAAVVSDRDGELVTVTYGALRAAANRFANGLAAAGIGPGDRVAIAMPMNLESVIAYLGIVLSGAVVVSVADSFAPAEIETRLRIAPIELAVTQDAISRAGKTLPMYEKVIAAGAPRAVVLDRGHGVALREDDASWDEFLAEDDHYEAVPREPADHRRRRLSRVNDAEKGRPMNRRRFMRHRNWLLLSIAALSASNCDD